MLNKHPHSEIRGYMFHPGPSLLGYEQVDVLLAAKPTHEHFDPEKAHILVGSGRNVQSLDLYHPWRQAREYPVVAGRIVLTDRVQKQVAIFTFGGQLTVTDQADHTHCVFNSTAPFLDLVTVHSVPTLLANEAEILLAQRRAARNLRIGEFDQLLLQIEPLALYTCCLAHIQAKFRQYPNYYDPLVQHFKHQLNLEIERLQLAGVWPAKVPQLGELI